MLRDSGQEYAHPMNVSTPLEYQYGRMEKRWVWFGEQRMRWRSMSRIRFYRWLHDSGALGRCDYDAADVLLLAGATFAVGPYILRAIPK
jgi:hypothetical protein